MRLRFWMDHLLLRFALTRTMVRVSVLTRCAAKLLIHITKVTRRTSAIAAFDASARQVASLTDIERHVVAKWSDAPVIHSGASRRHVEYGLAMRRVPSDIRLRAGVT